MEVLESLPNLTVIGYSATVSEIEIIHIFAGFLCSHLWAKQFCSGKVTSGSNCLHRALLEPWGKCSFPSASLQKNFSKDCSNLHQVDLMALCLQYYSFSLVVD